MELLSLISYIWREKYLSREHAVIHVKCHVMCHVMCQVACHVIPYVLLCWLKDSTNRPSKEGTGWQTPQLYGGDREFLDIAHNI